MQVYVQKSMRTTFPRNPAAVNDGELSHSVALPSEDSSPSMCRISPFAEPSMPSWVAARAAAVVPRKRRRSRSRRACTTSPCLLASAWISAAMAMPLCCTQRLETGAELRHERLRLLPRGEVATLVDPVVMNELGIGFLGPALRHLVKLVRTRGHCGGDRDGSRGNGRALAFPVHASSRGSGGREP